MAIFTGIAGAVTGLLSSTFLSGAVGSFLLRTAVGIGVSLLAQAIAGKPKEPVFAITGSLQGGGDLPRSFLFGRTSTAGSLVWVNTWGQDGDTPNAYLTQVIALSDLPIKALRKVWVNGQPVSLSGANSGWGWRVPEFDNSGGNLWVKFYDGTQTSVDTFLTDTCSNHNRQWDRNRVGRGVAYVIVTARVSKRMFSGIPQFQFEVDGCPLYDITKDSTAGGNGAHRWSDRSTWGGDGDDLPAVQVYNLLRGLNWNNQWFYGVQNMALARLPAADWIHAINKCRAPIQGASGLEPTFRAGGEISIDAPLANALEEFNTACHGRIAEIGGIYRMHVGAPDAPVVHFTDDDIISTEGQTFTPFFGLADSINGVSASYPASDDGWAMKAAPSIYNGALEALHGNRRLMAKVELNFVPYAEQVQRLMKAALLEAQRERRHTFVLPPAFWRYCTPGTVVVWSSKRNGYVNKQMRIDGVLDRPDLDVQVDLTEIDPSDYDWQSSTDYRPPIDGAVGPMRPTPQPIIDWFVEPATVRDNLDKPRRPAIKISWDGNKTDIAGVEYQVRNAASLEVQFSGRTDQPVVGALLISNGLLPNVRYGVRGRYLTDSPRETLWSDWLEVLTPNIKLNSDDVYFEVDTKEIIETVNRSNEWFNYQTREVIERARRNALLDIEQDAAAYDNIQQVRFELASSFQNAQSRWSYAIEVATGSNSAIGRRVEQIELTVGEDLAKAVNTLEGQITVLDGRVDANSQALLDLMVQVDGDISTAIDLMSVEITKVDDRVTANSLSLQHLSNQVGDISASVTVKAEAQSSSEGGIAQWGVQVKSGTSDEWLPAAFSIGSDGIDSWVLIQAKRFVIAGPNGELVDPFVFENGTVYLENARIGNVIFNQMSSANGKLILRGFGDFADFRLFT